MDEARANLRDEKAALRARMRESRKGLSDQTARSVAACARVESMPQYRAANHVAWYVSFGDEVATHDAIVRAFEGKAVVVPWCDGDALGLWRCHSLDELEPSTWGILEPPLARRQESGRVVRAHELDAVVVPGLAFDEQGGRLGYGRGYYDGLIATLRAGVPTIGLAFSEQVVPQVPMEAHDARLHWLVTDHRISSCRGS